MTSIPRTRLILLVLIVCGWPASAEGPREELNDYYPDIEPYQTGYLKVSDLHEIYYELCGHPQGKPVMILHGGPGGEIYPALRRFHDPTKYLIALLESYYTANRCFLEEGQLLRNAPKIGSIPTVIAQGRYDVVCPPITAHRLHEALPKSKLNIVEAAGHGPIEPRMASALIDAVKMME